MKISAIISDYDGTLSPTKPTKNNMNKIPEDLENVLWHISTKIPICILSSKDFHFLKDKVGFSHIVSCILGLETIVLRKQRNQITNSIKTTDKITENDIQIINLNNCTAEEFQEKSIMLEELSKEIKTNFRDITINKKRSVRNNILLGVTIDYRHLSKWENYKTNVEPHIINLIQNSLNYHNFKEFLVQKYIDHPFIDLYLSKASKANGIQIIKKLLGFDKTKKLLYLGDSESDNPAFKESDLSIGVKSDARLNTRLNSDYLLEFNELRPFLKRLEEHDFVFSNMENNLV